MGEVQHVVSGPPIEEEITLSIPEFRKVLAEQYDAGYEFCLKRVREEIGGLDENAEYEVNTALDALELPPKREAT